MHLDNGGCVVYEELQYGVHFRRTLFQRFCKILPILVFLSFCCNDELFHRL